MKAALFAIVAISLVSLVWGHAKLVDPTPWNPNPSKSSPCGGGSAPTAAATVWSQGAAVNIQWTVIAGDGTGPVRGSIDPTGGTSFTVPLPGIDGIASATTSVGDYNFAATVPNINCSLCTVQIMTDSNWFACATVQILPPGAPIAPIPQSCTTQYGLQYCDMQNGQDIAYEIGSNPLLTELSVAASTYYATINNTNVMTGGSDPNCQSAFKQYTCGNLFPVCGATTVCQYWCNQVRQYCQLTDTHQGLLPDCTTLPVDCPASTLSMGLFTIMALVVLLAGLFF